MTPKEVLLVAKWEKYIRQGAADVNPKGEEDVSEYSPLVDYPDEEEGEGSMQGQSKGKGFSPRASDGQGGQEGPSGTLIRGVVDTPTQVSGARESLEGIHKTL